MKISRALAFVAAGVGLSGFAATTDKVHKVNCQGPTCATTVTIESCKSYKVSTEPIVVAKGNKPVLRWTLVTPGWIFTKEGIDIKKHGTEFEGKAKESGASFKWKNKNTKPGEYKYNISVTDGNQVCTYDPTVVNQ